jgi:hypothetical protein
MNFFDKLIGAGDKKKKDDKKPGINNPFGKVFQGSTTFEGAGKSLGGSKPGRLIHFELAEPGPLGIKVSANADFVQVHIQ